MTMTDAREAAGDVERVARAMAESAGFAWEACAQEQWRRDARAGLAALPPAPASASARALREALEPFAEFADALRPNENTTMMSRDHDGRRRYITTEHLKAARRALASAAPEQAGEFARGVEAAAQWLNEKAVAALKAGATRDAILVNSFADSIRALAREPETRGWRDISTAPKDGTRILLFLCTRGTVRRGYPEICWWGEHPDWGASWLRFNGKETVGPGVATHWQPLPAPPASAARAKEET